MKIGSSLFQQLMGSYVEPVIMDYCKSCDGTAFFSSFGDLPVDPYFPKEISGRRRRRFGSFAVSDEGNEITPLPHSPFFQSLKLNSVAGGIQRNFSPLDPTVRDSSVLHSLLRLLVMQLDEPQVSWEVNVHQVRSEATGGPTLPAPEGIHRDGHDFLAIVGINRLGIVGGENRVFDERKKLILETTLLEPFDLILIDDRRTYHSVSPIHSPSQQIGYRDIFILDFNRVSAGL